MDARDVETALAITPRFHPAAPDDVLWTPGGAIPGRRDAPNWVTSRFAPSG
jgi:hypothetical protein